MPLYPRPGAIRQTRNNLRMGIGDLAKKAGLSFTIVKGMEQWPAGGRKTGYTHAEAQRVATALGLGDRGVFELFFASPRSAVLDADQDRGE